MAGKGRLEGRVAGAGRRRRAIWGGMALVALLAVLVCIGIVAGAIILPTLVVVGIRAVDKNKGGQTFGVGLIVGAVTAIVLGLLYLGGTALPARP